MSGRIGITRIEGKEITIAGNAATVKAIKDLSKMGLITFSRMIRFKSTEYAVYFF